MTNPFASLTALNASCCSGVYIVPRMSFASLGLYPIDSRAFPTLPPVAISAIPTGISVKPIAPLRAVTPTSPIPETVLPKKVRSRFGAGACRLAFSASNSSRVYCGCCVRRAFSASNSSSVYGIYCFLAVFSFAISASRSLLLNEPVALGTYPPGSPGISL